MMMYLGLEQVPQPASS